MLLHRRKKINKYVFDVAIFAVLCIICQSINNLSLHVTFSAPSSYQWLLLILLYHRHFTGHLHLKWPAGLQQSYNCSCKSISPEIKVIIWLRNTVPPTALTICISLSHAFLYIRHHLLFPTWNAAFLQPVFGSSGHDFWRYGEICWDTCS